MRLSVLLSVLPLVMGAPATEKREPAALIKAKENAIPGKYIVKLREGSPLAALEDALSKLNGKADAKFENVFKGFAASMDDALVEVLRHHPDVSHRHLKITEPRSQ